MNIEQTTAPHPGTVNLSTTLDPNTINLESGGGAPQLADAEGKGDDSIESVLDAELKSIREAEKPEAKVEDDKPKEAKEDKAEADKAKEENTEEPADDDEADDEDNHEPAHPQRFAQDVSSEHGPSQSESYRGIGEAGAVHHPDAARYTNRHLYLYSAPPPTWTRLTVAEIDHNFSRAHRIVTTNILPIVEQYGKHSEAVWEGSKFWKQFFEASANVSLSGYEEPAPDDSTAH